MRHVGAPLVPSRTSVPREMEKSAVIGVVESLRPCYPPETVALAARRKFFQHCERGGRLACLFSLLLLHCGILKRTVFEINFRIVG